MINWLKCLLGYHDWTPTIFFSSRSDACGERCRRCNAKRYPRNFPSQKPPSHG
jgi:hypothetical protein